MPHVVQIAATELRRGYVFNCYARPKLPQTQSPRIVTGINADSSDVPVAGESVDADCTNSATEKFINYLKTFDMRLVFLFWHRHLKRYRKKVN